MQPHEERVLKEKEELDKKIEKLSTFLGSANFNTISVLEQSDLVRQRFQMIDYSDTLKRRIERFS